MGKALTVVWIVKLTESWVGIIHNQIYLSWLSSDVSPILILLFLYFAACDNFWYYTRLFTNCTTYELIAFCEFNAKAYCCN